MAARKPKPNRVFSILDALSIGYNELESLRDEVSEVCDNLEEKFSSTSRYEAMCEARDALDSAINNGEPTLPDWFTDVKNDGKASFDKPDAISLPPAGRSSSRAARRDDAVMILTAAKDAIESVKESMDVEESTIGDDLTTAERIEQLESVVDDIQTMIDESESVEFPGMFG